MKKVVSILLCVALSLGLLACADTDRDWQEQYDLGMRYLEDGDYEEAIVAFSAAIEIDGNRPEAYVGRAQAHIAQGNPEEALKDYKKAKRIAERSEEDYEDLIDELDELIDGLEEEIGEADDRNEQENPVDAEQYTVTDAYTSQFEHYGGTYCCHIPQINLKDNLAASVNEQIYEELIELVQEQDYELIYTWGIQGDILSVVVQASFLQWDWVDFYVYTVSTETGESVSREALLGAYGLNEADYSALAYSTLEQDVTSFNPEQIGQYMYDYIVDNTLAEENIQGTVPFVGKDGHLCMVAARYSPAGAGYYYGLYDITAGIREQYLTCTESHEPSTDVAADTHTVSEITALVVQWYNNNIGGYESGYFTADESDCFLVHDKCSVSVYFYDTDTSAPGTEALPFAVVQVDVNTGEMWDVMTGNSLAYLW